MSMLFGIAQSTSPVQPASHLPVFGLQYWPTPQSTAGSAVTRHETHLLLVGSQMGPFGLPTQSAFVTHSTIVVVVVVALVVSVVVVPPVPPVPPPAVEVVTLPPVPLPPVPEGGGLPSTQAVTNAADTVIAARTGHARKLMESPHARPVRRPRRHAF
jgi:hypothetical protein